MRNLLVYYYIKLSRQKSQVANYFNICRSRKTVV